MTCNIMEPTRISDSRNKEKLQHSREMHQHQHISIKFWFCLFVLVLLLNVTFAQQAQQGVYVCDRYAYTDGPRGKARHCNCAPYFKWLPAGRNTEEGCYVQCGKDEFNGTPTVPHSIRVISFEECLCEEGYEWTVRHIYVSCEPIASESEI